MKKCFVGTGIMLLALLLYNCKGQQKEIKLDWEVDSSESKTFVLGDGHVVTDSIGVAPMNEKITVRDKNGRLCGEAGTPSEGSDFQIVRYIYGNSGNRLEGVVVSYADYSEVETEDVYEQIRETKNIVVSRILYGGETKENVVWYKFRREGDKIVEVYDDVDALSLKADEGSHIEYEVEEDDNFWRNDIIGGNMVILLHIVPDDCNVKEYTIGTYCGYRLQMRSTFRNGWLCERIIYDDESDEVVARGKMEEMDGLHIYTIDGRYRYVFENGVLKTTEYISKYGTVLEQNVYFLSLDKMEYIHYYKEYDYKKKTLVRKSEERIDKSQFLQENSEEDALKMAGVLGDIWWGKAYSESKIANNMQ